MSASAVDARVAHGVREPDEVEVAIVGTGFAGLGMAIALARAGRRSFVLFERESALGGTWRQNTYPGCACDIPSALYSFSFEPNPDWSRHYASQPEILAYLERCADKYGIRPHIRFDTAITDAVFDPERGTWRVQSARGETVTARHLVLGLGALNRPAYPRIEGIDRFAGKVFHSAEWDHSCDLSGKRVGVVGTGASAIQFLPRVASRAARTLLFQRTAPWVLPRLDGAVPARMRRVYAAVPALQRAQRHAIYCGLELVGLGLTKYPRMLGAAAALGRWQIHRQITDPTLRRAVTPEFAPGCKRILLANDYYPTLARADVAVLTEAIARATPAGLVTRDGREHALDVLIYGTGFRIADVFTPLRVVGLQGRELNAVWRDGMEAYLGTTVAGFPNFYTLTGPNTGLGHNSMVFMMEAQIAHVLACIAALDARGARYLTVRSRAQREFNEAIRPRLARTVWASGCKSWYLDAEGRNSTLWPGSTVEFWWRTRRLRPEHYEFAPAVQPSPTRHAPARAATEREAIAQ